MDKATGKKVWGGDPGVCGYASPVPFKQGGKTAIAIFAQKELLALSPATGQVLWSFPWQTAHDVNAADPLRVGNNHLFISSGYGRGCAMLDLTGNTPKLAWENKNISNHFSSSIATDGFVYGIDGNAGRGQLKCLDATDGTVKWAHNTGFASILAANRKLIILNESGQLMIAELAPDAYRELYSAQTPLTKTCWTMPVLANGLLYCRNDKGTLVCIDLRQP